MSVLGDKNHRRCLIAFSGMIFTSCGFNKTEEPLYEHRPGEPVYESFDTQTSLGEGLECSEGLNPYSNLCIERCKTGPDRKEYCLEDGEQPSDLVPDEKISLCEYGFLNQGVCETDVEIQVSGSVLNLFVGGSLRFEAQGDIYNLHNLTLGPSAHNKLYLSYSTYFTTDFFQEYPTGDATYEFPRGFGPTTLEIRMRSNRYSDQENIPRPHPVRLNFNGVGLQTNNTSLAAWKAACLDIHELETNASYSSFDDYLGEHDQHDAIVNLGFPGASETGFACMTPKFTSTIFCDTNEENCSVTQLLISWESK